jgi:RNA polymerase sigma-70 factor (ECF subfamily)
MSQSIDHELLIQRAKSGDKESLEMLLVAYFDQLYRHVARRMPDSARRNFSAEDVTQGSLLEACMKIDQFRETSPKAFVVWLKAIGELTLLRRLRDESRQKRGGRFRRLLATEVSRSDSVLSLLDKLPAAAKTASSIMARHEALGALQVAVARLPTEQRKAIELHLLQGKSLEETARALGRTQAAVRGLVHRGKQQLAESMGRVSKWLGVT